ncbi:MAG TPA: hypothetical protein VFI11_10045 [Anaerolineales bacterium]|nr:hypothetical protein [Anaerolineales bacterium]
MDAPLTWVDDGIFAGGGEQLPASWQDFADQTGITAVVHLRPEMPAVFRGPCAQRFLWLSISDEAETSAAERFLAGSFLASCRSEGHRVLLHSSLGRHRTRWVYVACRILEGMPARVAVRRASRPPWMSPYATDVAAWETFASKARAA